MSRTRIICPKCQIPLAWCKCGKHATIGELAVMTGSASDDYQRPAVSQKWWQDAAKGSSMIKHINYIVECKFKPFDGDWLCCESFHTQEEAADFLAKNKNTDYAFRLVKQTVTEELIQ